MKKPDRTPEEQALADLEVRATKQVHAILFKLQAGDLALEAAYTAVEEITLLVSPCVSGRTRDSFDQIHFELLTAVKTEREITRRHEQAVMAANMNGSWS